MNFLTKLWAWLQKAPSFVWILVFVGGVAGLIGGIILIFSLLAKVEGFASIIFLVVGWFSMRGLATMKESSSPKKIIVAGTITFYALMGMAVDQPGNPIFNQPLQWLCPSGTRLNRGVTISHPLPERTDITQDFRCLDESGKTVQRISMGYVILLRFVEYVLVAYIMLGLNSRGKSRSF